MFPQEKFPQEKCPQEKCPQEEFARQVTRHPNACVPLARSTLPVGVTPTAVRTQSMHSAQPGSSTLQESVAAATASLARTLGREVPVARPPAMASPPPPLEGRKKRGSMEMLTSRRGRDRLTCASRPAGATHLLRNGGQNRRRPRQTSAPLRRSMSAGMEDSPCSGALGFKISGCRG